MVLKNHQKGFFRSKITRSIELQSNGVDDFAICPTIDPELERKTGFERGPSATLPNLTTDHLSHNLLLPEF